jgi:hypothetical protein
MLALQALEALGLALEGHFHILLPSLVRLLPSVNTTVTPKDTKRRILGTMAKLLPRMRLAPYASAVVHPLMLTLRDSREAEVCADALATICSVSVAVGENMALFVPAINGVIAHAQSHGAGGMLPLERWARLVDTLERGAAPAGLVGGGGGGGECGGGGGGGGGARDAWDDGIGWAAEMDAVTYNHRLSDPPENAPTALHRGARRCQLELRLELLQFSMCPWHGMLCCWHDLRDGGLCSSQQQPSVTLAQARLTAGCHSGLYLHRVPPTQRPLKSARARAVSQENLKKAWESSQRCTKEDWLEWMRRLGVELLAHSSSSALRSCHELALVQPNMARELFSVGFVSCWLDIDEAHQKGLVRSLEAALASPTIPPEIVTALLNLAEFMEHDERPLPLDTRTLGALAEKCHAFAKVCATCSMRGCCVAVHALQLI